MVKGQIDAQVTLKMSSQIQALVNQECQTQRLVVWQARAPDSAAGGHAEPQPRWDAWMGCPDGMPGRARLRPLLFWVAAVKGLA